MLPSDLKAEQFSGYQPRSRKLVIAHLRTLQELPLSFVPSLLREVIDYDFKFPAERTSIDQELATLSSLAPAQLKEWFQAFSLLSLSPKLEKLDWINQPAQFVEQLSAYLWTTHQLDAFRDAAIAYGNRSRIAASPEPIVMRIGMSMEGAQPITVPCSVAFRFRNWSPYAPHC